MPLSCFLSNYYWLKENCWSQRAVVHIIERTWKFKVHFSLHFSQLEWKNMEHQEPWFCAQGMESQVRFFPPFFFYLIFFFFGTFEGPPQPRISFTSWATARARSAERRWLGLDIKQHHWTTPFVYEFIHIHPSIHVYLYKISLQIIVSPLLVV